MSEKAKKYEKYLTVFAIVGFFTALLGAISFFILTIPSIVTPLSPFEGILGSIPLTYPWLNIHAGIFFITFPWFNLLTIFGLLLLIGGCFARLLGVGKKNHVVNLLIIALVICLGLTAFGVQVQASGNNYPPPNSLYPTPTPYYPTPPPYTYPPNPTYSPYPTSDPTAWSITQLYETEYVSGSYYYPPTSFRTVAAVEPVISTGGYTHQIDTWGTYDNWEFDVYYKEEGTNVWHYGDSGTTSAGGHGVAYIPVDSSMSRETFTVVAFLDPTDFNYDNYFANDVSDAAVANAIAAGTCRASNFLTFTVEVQYVL